MHRTFTGESGGATLLRRCAISIIIAVGLSASAARAQKPFDTFCLLPLLFVLFTCVYCACDLPVDVCQGGTQNEDDGANVATPRVPESLQRAPQMAY